MLQQFDFDCYFETCPTVLDSSHPETKVHTNQLALPCYFDSFYYYIQMIVLTCCTLTHHHHIFHKIHLIFRRMTKRYYSFQSLYRCFHLFLFRLLSITFCFSLLKQMLDCLPIGNYCEIVAICFLNCQNHCLMCLLARACLILVFRIGGPLNLVYLYLINFLL